MLTRRELLIGGAALAACALGPNGGMQATASESRIEPAAMLMDRFAARTGLTGPDSRRRYLWTDAFAVRNLLALRRATGVARWSALAATLVDRVHDVLAPKHDPSHPTGAGLRIGKKLPERTAGEPYDEELEWDRDGQYFHYLTQWMHALDQFAHATRQPEPSRWACELANVAYRAFVYKTDGRRRMYWKMSIDLTRPLVTSMGQHDALEGYVTYLQLATSWRAQRACADLTGAIDGLDSMIEPDALTTPDPLGIGGLLVAASRLHQLLTRHGRGDRRLLDAVIASSVHGLESYARGRGLRGAADGRLAFRELGLAIGLAACESLPSTALRPYQPLRDQIESFWLEPAHRANETWREHEDINDVMLASALLSVA